ncbi:RNA-dependent RNA polymerase 1-like isoform X2 [Citrus sinensis]|uniref:RNA-dependent RNA polymerase 1-like isoform X2 n=1 Tax=Citrus sinensis TaxID=2711 RepID=UPI002278394F|nr:RNA-dependent RNA polymerase 1-like isoform X2 [Citrus sinensis]
MAKMITLSGFASPVSPKALKDFLEEHTGEGTVSDVEVGQNKGLKAHAVVEFTTVEAADLIMSLAGNSYLKASYVKRRTPHYKLGDDLKLNFGCQISKDKFSVFWSPENVSVKLCSDLRKFEFFLSYESVDSRFELSDESISQIELHIPSGHSVKYLVIQLHGPPMIYKNDIHWVREVDFTPSSSVGKSSAICLELPTRAHIPKALKDLFYYKESPVQFTLVPGSVFSCNSDLVPMTYGKKNDKKGKGKGKASLNQVNKDGVKCFFCRKKGHMKKACPNYRTWLEKKKGLLKPKQTDELQTCNLFTE